MIVKMIEGVTRVIGKSQGYLGLPLRDEIIECTVGGIGTPAMVTAWEPTPDELERLNAGAYVLLRVIGNGHPPVMLDVGPAPLPDNACEVCGGDCAAANPPVLNCPRDAIRALTDAAKEPDHAGEMVGKDNADG